MQKSQLFLLLSCVYSKEVFDVSFLFLVTLADSGEGGGGRSLASVVEHLPLSYDMDNKNLGRTFSLGPDKDKPRPFTPGHIRRSSYESASITLDFQRRTTTAKGTPAITPTRCLPEIASSSGVDKQDEESCAESETQDSGIGESPGTSSKQSSLDRRSINSDLDEAEKPPENKSRLLTFSKNFFSMTKSEKPWKMFGNKQKNSPVVPPTALILEERPSGLPAKSEEEAAYHRQLHWNLIESNRKKEQKAEKERRQMRTEQKRLEEQAAAACRVWTEQILPRWNEMKDSKRCRELWWQGVPAKVRGTVWSLAVGNKLVINQEQYNEMLAQVKAKIEDKGYKPTGNSAEILVDISRTFPNLGIFQQGGPYYEHLMILLEVYALYKPDIGYMQSMPFHAAVLLLQMDPYPAFLAFANMLNFPLQSAFFELKQPQMTEYFIAFDHYFEQELNVLHKHFDELDVRPDLYLIEWIYGMFAKSLPLDITCRIWDVYLRDGEEFVFKTALGILKMYEGKLLQLDFGDCVEFLTKLPESISGPELFRNIEPFMRANYENSKTRKSFSLILHEVDEKINPNGTVEHSQISSNVMGIRMSKSLSGFIGDFINHTPRSTS